MELKKSFFIFIFLLSVSILIFSSDRSDATDLMNKCDKESKIIEIPAKNFGDKKDIASFDEGIMMIKQGKVKLAQSKYLEAKAKFDEYIKLQYALYDSLAAKYIQRTEQLSDKIGEDLADFITQDDVLKNFTGASQYLQSAKSYMAKKHYESVIQPCRIAKNYLISIYNLVNKDIPKEYEKDITDYNNKIFEGK